MLATLQKLPVGEKQTAINLLKVTVNHQLGDSVPLKDNQNLSESEKYFYQDGSSHCPLQEEASQESEGEFEQHPSAVNEGQEVDEDLCLNHEVPESQVHPQDSHLKHAIGENISFNILHHLSDTDCLENTLTETEAKNDTELAHKDSRVEKEEDGRRKNVSSELKINIDTGHNSQGSCCLKDHSVIHRKEDGILIQLASESQKNLLERRALYNLHSGLKDDGNNENQQHTCLESLGKYSEVLHVSEEDRLLGHAHEHTSVPLLTQNEQQLTLITSREFCEGSQEVSELGTILDAQDHDRDLSVLEEQNGDNSHGYVSGGSLLHLRIVNGKQDQSEAKLESCDKSNALNENSCNSLNLSHFHHISDRDNIYSEENSYLLPYLERDNYDKIGYKIENITKKSDQEGLEKSLEASYSSDHLECDERRETLGELEQDKTPVDLSSTSGSVQNAKIDSCIMVLEESPSDPQQPQGFLSNSDPSHTWNRGKAKPSQAQHMHKQKRVRSENKRHKHAKLDKILPLKEERPVKDADSCELHGREPAGKCHSFEASVSAKVESVNLDPENSSTECSSEQVETDIQGEPCYEKETNSSQNKDVQSSNLLPVSCRNCKKELPDILLFLVHQRQCEGHLSCPICFAKFVHKVCWST